jgi:DNA-binding winged helix-turn-helix (wHTH) protein/tetratricopeptide (TPR) repeat protein
MNYIVNDFEIDVARQELRYLGEMVPIQKKVFELLQFLIANRDRALSKDEIQDAVWPGTIVSDTAITRAVLKARRAINDDAQKQSLIRTVHGHGYRFVGDATEIQATDMRTNESGMASRRRGDLLKVVSAYGAIAWILNQIAAMVWEAFELPKLPLQILLGLSLAGLPIVFVITWWFRYSESGLRLRDERAKSLDTKSSSKNKGRYYILVTIALALSTSGLLIWQMQSPETEIADKSLVKAPSGRVVILPLQNITGNPGNNWTRLGLMSLIDQQVKEAGSSTVSSRIVMDMVGEDISELEVNEGLLNRFNESQGAQVLVAPVLDRVDGILNLTLTVYQSGEIQEFSTADDVIPTELAMKVADQLVQFLNPVRTISKYHSGTSDDPFVNEIYARGLNQELTGNLVEARNLFEVAVSQDPEFFLARYEYAITTRFLGYFDEAEPILKQLYVEAQQLENPERLVMLSNAIGILHDLKGDMDKAESIYKTGIELAEENDIYDGGANLLVNLAIVEKNRGDLIEARGLLGRAIAFYHKSNTPVSGSLYITLGNVAVSEGDLGETDSNYHKALASFRQQESRSGEAIALSNLSWLARQLHKYDEALEYLNQSIEIRRDIDDRVGILKSLVMQGALQYSMGKFDDCQISAELILADSHVREENDLYATAITYLGMIASERNEFDHSIEKLDEAIGIRESRQDISGKLRTENMLSSVYIRQGDYMKARSQLSNTIEDSQVANLPTAEIEALLHLAEIDKLNGDLESSEKKLASLLEKVRRLSDAPLENKVSIKYARVLMAMKQTDTADGILTLMSDVVPDRDLLIARAELASLKLDFDGAAKTMQDAKSRSNQRWTSQDESSLQAYSDKASSEQ